MKKTSLLLLLLTVAVASSCRRSDRPADVLDAPAMVAFLTEAYLLEGFYAVETQYRYDALSPEVLAAYDDILSRHHTTREAVERSFDFYAAHPGLYQSIQDSVIARLDALAEPDDSQTSRPKSAPRINL
ncbi:MAG: DUF4296 domain-containing protein [Bacteroidales bacterium]|nr:DUF4296 domain-containing protein [Bacteroidales bacterium]